MLKIAPKNFNFLFSRMLYCGTTFYRNFAINQPLQSIPLQSHVKLLDFNDFSKRISKYSTDTGYKVKQMSPSMNLTYQPNSPKKKVVVMMAWMLAKEKHMKRYQELYLKEGFDVLTIYLTPKQMLFPVGGSQIVAKNIVEYLEQNECYKDIIVHAFSVGAYLCGEVMLQMEKDPKFLKITDRIKGIVLDSPADIQNIPKGFPRAISNNPILVKCIEMYTMSHLWLLHNVATKHYIQSSLAFHNTLFKCPALVLVSLDDEVGGPKSIGIVTDKWAKKGIDLKYKVWNKSKHVSHLHFHEKDYKEELDTFLRKLHLGS